MGNYMLFSPFKRVRCSPKLREPIWSHIQFWLVVIEPKELECGHRHPTPIPPVLSNAHAIGYSTTNVFVTKHELWKTKLSSLYNIDLRTWFYQENSMKMTQGRSLHCIVFQVAGLVVLHM
jgi:hypothetical protein